MLFNEVPSFMTIHYKSQSVEDHIKALHKTAEEAASTGDPSKLVLALSENSILDGFKRRLQSKWDRIPSDDIDIIVAEAIDILYASSRNGNKFHNVMGYLWKTCDHKAHQHDRLSQKVVVLDDIEQVPDNSSDPALETIHEEYSRERMRQQAIALARSLLPRLGQENIQAIMGYVINAVELGYEELSNQEIADALGLTLETVRRSLSRGFDRMTRIASQERLLNSDFNLNKLRPVDDDSEIDELGK